MNILFYKLLARNELLEQAKYVLNARDFEYTLENQIRACGYNPIEKLKELEDDIDSQVLTPEIRDHILTKPIYDSIIEYMRTLDNLIKERFKYHGIFITNQIYKYLSTKDTCLN